MSAARTSVVLLTLALFGFNSPSRRESIPSISKLHIEEVGSDSMSFDVVATMVVGPTEVLLWDAQYHVADARRVADRIAATGKHLKAILISHPDHDHYSGAAAIVERFPGTPVYMTAKALAHYDTTKYYFQREKSRRPAMLPDSLVTPQVLPSMQLTVDGEELQVIPDLTGDVLIPTNSVLWIPSLRTVLAGDVAFNGVHPWLGSSSAESRAAWRASIARIGELHPAAVVAGHKKDVNAADSPDVLRFMDNYLRDFDAFRKTSANADELRSAMLRKYPDLAVPMLLGYGAQVAFKTQS